MLRMSLSKVMVETSRLFIISIPAGDSGASELVQSVQVARACARGTALM